MARLNRMARLAKMTREAQKDRVAGMAQRPERTKLLIVAGEAR